LKLGVLAFSVLVICISWTKQSQHKN
jgi:hypothetical protein